jgi:hypothetical protein
MATITGLKNEELKAIWVLENIRPTTAFALTDVELLYLEASVKQWKKMKGTPCYLICTEEVFAYLGGLTLLGLWDGFDTEILAIEDTVKRSPFWACAKLKAMKEIAAPFVMMDNDFFLVSDAVINETPRVREDGRFFFGTDIFDGRYPLIVSHEEDGSGHYLNSKDYSLFEAGIDDLYSADPYARAYNVSFLYIRDDSFRAAYSAKAWRWLELLSAIATPPTIDKSQPRWRMIRSNLHGGYMIFCEQKLLYDMAEESAYTTKTLIPEIYSCTADMFFENSSAQNCIEHLGRKKLLLGNPVEHELYKNTALAVLGRL